MLQLIKPVCAQSIISTASSDCALVTPRVGNQAKVPLKKRLLSVRRLRHLSRGGFTAFAVASQTGIVLELEMKNSWPWKILQLI